MPDPHARGRLPSPDEAEQLFRTVAASAPPTRARPPVRNVLRAMSRRARSEPALGVLLLVLIGGTLVATQTVGSRAPTTSETSAPARAAPSPGRTGGLRAVGLGVCLTVSPALTTDAVDVVPCDATEARFLAVTSVELARGPWPGLTSAFQQADGLCRDLLSGGSAVDRPPMFAYPPVVPSEAQWAVGDRTAFCLLPR